MITLSFQACSFSEPDRVERAFPAYRMLLSAIFQMHLSQLP
jgi:hypothetical protein